MIDYINIAFTVLFSQNMLLVFTFAFGTDPKSFLRPKQAFVTGVSLTLCLMILAPLSRILYQSMNQWGVTYFSLLCDTLLATVGTFYLGNVLEKLSPDLWQYSEDAVITLPTNAALLGSLLICGQRGYTPTEAFVFALFGGLGVLVTLLTLVGIRQNQQFHQAPEFFRGLPLLFITAGLMSLSLVGFYGLNF